MVSTLPKSPAVHHGILQVRDEPSASSETGATKPGASMEPEVGDVWRCSGSSGSYGDWILVRRDGTQWFGRQQSDPPDSEFAISLGYPGSTSAWSRVRPVAMADDWVSSSPLVKPPYCAGTAHHDMTVKMLRRQVAHTYNVWPTCKKHGVELEVVEFDQRKAVLRCPKQWV